MVQQRQLKETVKRGRGRTRLDDPAKLESLRRENVNCSPWVSGPKQLTRGPADRIAVLFVRGFVAAVR